MQHEVSKKAEVVRVLVDPLRSCCGLTKALSPNQIPQPKLRVKAMDDFKDLVWTSSSSSTPNSTSAAGKPGSNYDPFSMLAASSTANRGTPNYLSGSGPPSRTLTPSNVAKPPQSSTTSSSDAFSGLLSLGGSSGTGANMSIAERQAQAERKRREEEERKAQEAKLHGAFWDKFDVGGSVGGGRSSSTGLPAKTSANGPSTLLPSAAKPTSTGATNPSLGGILQPSSRPISPAKWDKAKEDWEKLAGIGNTWGPVGAKAKTEAFRGLDRCRKALAPPPPPAQSTSAASSTPKPKATPKPRPAAVSSGPSEASARLRAANRAAEADEAERYRLKDSIEARLIAWKGGKENNIRALVASLENVLWPELNWVKVGMHELITEQQVKIRYMKAIAKVHPDKLRNATVEHQMIANGVFGALNDAYNVFKPS
ncbi:hypothetical protein M407DRAFT_6189 [Tulasnella calospora MUT 4182]|uniref:J domain-containing protein n=1 Tax=Tulasnella calospora MUT 4182 TaxID=1051891 RepID=A0A0C3L6P8_9AGAM|nr:hypothetical protein M407DRAFT_6189 [Tulasnella calospora MUT 4182]